MNFQYSPGLIGYGVKGSDGSAGLTGLAIYFTDRDPVSDVIALRSAIQNNEVLWSTAVPGTKLPGGRVYNLSDLFIDPRGFVYRIISGPNYYLNTGMSLNKSTYFKTSSPAVLSDNGFARWYNKGDVEKFIIDNVFSDQTGNYSSSPVKIYGIESKDFARIEYSNTLDASYYNAFSVYSSGETTIADDHKAFAIVRNTSSNYFHIGNLSSSLRDTGIVLDVSSLIYSRDSSQNKFHKNTISGTVLTNAEINTPLLFDPLFTKGPASFNATPGPTYVVLNWNLLDFINDPDVKGTLCFYKKENIGNYNIDASVLRPLEFFNLQPSGSLTVSLLKLGETYEYYINLVKDGWERRSEIKPITTSNVAYYMNIVQPVSTIIDFNDIGKFGPSYTLYNYPATIDTNSFTGWNITAVPKPSWITTSIQSGPSGVNAIDVSVQRNTLYTARSGVITFTSEAATKIITVNQARRAPITRSVKFVATADSTYANVEFDPPLDAGQTVSLTMTISAYAYAHGSATHPRTCNTQIDLLKNGTLQTSAFATATDHGGDDNWQKTPVTTTITGVVNGTTIRVQRNATYFDCGSWSYPLSSPYIDSRAYGQLVSATDGYDTFVVDSFRKYWNISKLHGGGCVIDSAVSSSPLYT